MNGLSAEELLSLLGLAGTDASVTRVLQELEQRVDLEGGRSTAIAAPRQGIGLRFSAAETLPGLGSGVGPSTLVVACVFFYAPGHAGHVGFSSALPYGLRFAQSRAEVRALLGDPDWSATKRNNDRWDFERQYLTVDFTPDERSSRLVSVGLPWRTES